MRRREFVALVGGATLVWPLATRAQQAERIWRIGVLLAHTEQDARWALFTAFKERLAQLGWVEGRNMRMDVKLTSGNAEAIAKAAGELVANSPDVIFGTNNAVTKALKNATQTIPVVFAGVSDPIGSGIVTSLTRPDQNVTGFQAGEGEIAGKWLQLLKEIAPDIRRIAFVYNPVEPVHEGWLRVAEAVAPSLGITLVQAPVSRTEDIEPALTGFASQPNGAFVVAPHAVTTAASELFIALATRLRLPAMYYLRAITARGGLSSYGPDFAAQYQGGATYVDRLLRGAKVGDLPVQLPTTYQFAINLGTARALGLSVAPTLLARADEVID